MYRLGYNLFNKASAQLGIVNSFLWNFFSETDDGTQVLFLSEESDGSQVLFELEQEDR